MVVLIIDYKMNNLGSLRRSLEECGAQVIVSDNPADLERADRIILPGVGTFSDAMRNLTQQNWIPALRKEVIEKEKPLLGICLGMQILADIGYEYGTTQGLGFIPGKVEKLTSHNPAERVPHVGWNDINIAQENQNSGLFNNISNHSDFYFVHSYHFIPEDPNVIIGSTDYCGTFVAAVNKNNIFGVQFHPEKSSSLGFALLKNFLNIQNTKGF